MSCQCRIYTKYIENQGSFKYNTKEMWVSPSRSLVLSIPEAALGDVHTPLWNLKLHTWYEVETLTTDSPWKKMLIDNVITLVTWPMFILPATN